MALKDGDPGGMGVSVGQLASWSCENCQFWFPVSKNQTGMGSDFWNWELEPGLKLDPILEPELNLHGSKTRTRSFGQKYCILVVFKLPDCTSNNTYGELRFNIFCLELCQFVGRGQLGKALAYCFFKSIHHVLKFSNTVHSHS
jgi:hypothetical protein